MSDIETFCDALVAELASTVDGLEVAETHTLSAWDPAALEADGARHLAVWPAAEAADLAEPLAIGSHMLSQRFLALVWEPSDEGPRQVADRDANSAFWDLYEAARARLYVQANEQLASSFKVWFESCSFPERAGVVRFFRMQILRQRPIAFTS